MTQSAVDKEIYNAFDGKSESSVDSLEPRFDARRSHSQDAYPMVTRAQWQAERDRQKGGEWKRHRGGDKPKSVSDGEMVEVRLRCGDTQTAYADKFLWNHSDCDESVHITKYRVISQPQAGEVEVKASTREYSIDGGKTFEPFPAEGIYMTDAVAGNEYLEAKTDQIDGPIKWRDTIIHCQAIIEDCEREIQRNVDLLDAEGLMMQVDSKKAMQAYDEPVQLPFDQWQIGDIVEVISTHSFCNRSVRIGDQYPISQRDSVDVKGPTGTYGSTVHYKFIRRP